MQERTKFEPLSDEFNSAKLDEAKWWNHNPQWYGRAPSRYLAQNVTQQNGNMGLTMTLDKTLPEMPVAAGPYVPDAFTDTKNGRGITWGLCHITNVGERDKKHSILARFDCFWTWTINL